MHPHLSAALASLVTGTMPDPRAAIIAAPATCAIVLVVTVIVAGTQGALLASGPRPNARHVCRTAALAGLVPLALVAPVITAALLFVALAGLPRRRAANDNLPIALGVNGWRPASVLRRRAGAPHFFRGSCPQFISE